MAMTGKDFKSWAASLDDEDMVAVDDGGLCLVVQSKGVGLWSDPGAGVSGPYLEIGGIGWEGWEDDEEEDEP